MRYQPTLESVSTHPVPQWFQDAKFGIFVHWGLYSVPAWAPIAGELGDVLESGDWSTWFANNPYAEWYANSYRIEGGATYQHHRQTYGADFDYAAFSDEFKSASAGWDPEEWADLFALAGARYVVLTTKHHDGFLLWPSETPNPFIDNYQSERDLVGELSAAVRARQLQMGLYYSGGLDWTFNDRIIQGLDDLRDGTPQQTEYVAYANAHWRELIARYQPMVLWNDIAYPRETNLNLLFSEYYSEFPNGLVNNRFTQNFQLEDKVIKSDNHFDFETPEYTSFDEIREIKWESCRGIGASFGYNRIETVEQYLTFEELVRSFVDIVSKNGNLLLNVGPMADGALPPLQRERLTSMGAWLQIYGDAIFDTRPWHTAASHTDSGVDVRFTCKDDTLFFFLLDTPARTRFEIADLRAAEGTQITFLGAPNPLEWQQLENGIAIQLHEPLPHAPAYAFRMTPQPQWIGDRS